YVKLDDLSIGNNNLTVNPGTTGATVSLTNAVNGAGNEMQRISQTGGGSFSLSFGGITAPLRMVAASTSAATIQGYINTISTNVTNPFQGVPTGVTGAPVTTLSGNTTVFGATGGPYYVVFRNQLAFTDVPRFYPAGTIGTQVAGTNILGNGGGPLAEGPAF